MEEAGDLNFGGGPPNFPECGIGNPEAVSRQRQNNDWPVRRDALAWQAEIGSLLAGSGV